MEQLPSDQERRKIINNMEISSISIVAIFDVVSNFIYFLCAIFLAIFIPGDVIARKYFDHKSKFEKLILFLACGLILWAYQGVIFGYLRVRWMSYLYLAFFFLAWLRSRPSLYKLNNLRAKLWKIDVVLLSIIVIGIFGQINRFLLTGYIFPEGIHIFTISSDDAFWHAALTNQIVRRFPPDEPGLSGVRVYNYHYWSNLLIAELIRVFHLPILTTQFFYAPLVLSFLLGGLAYVLAKALSFSNWGVYLSVYLLYFSSDIIYLVTFVTSRKFIFSIHPLEDGTMFWENPPRAFSFVISLLGLILLKSFLKLNNFKLGLLTALVLGSVIGFKVHTGIMVLGGVFTLLIYGLIKRKWKIVVMTLTSIIISFLVYYPVNNKSGFPVFAPFEMSRMFIVQDKLQLSFLELRRRIYGEGFNPIAVFTIDFIMLIIFLISQLGIRNLGWLIIMGIRSTLEIPLRLFLSGAILTSVLFGTLFIQPVAYADIFNSYLAASFFLWVYTSIFMNSWFRVKNIFFRVTVIICLFLVTLPRWLYKTNLDIFNIHKTKVNITSAEIDAADYLARHTSTGSLVLVANAGQWDSLYPYVSIFANRDMFLSGQGILGRHGISYIDREQLVKKLLNSDNPGVARKILEQTKINYIYFYGAAPLSKGLQDLPIEKVFQNESNTIYKI